MLRAESFHGDPELHGGVAVDADELVVLQTDHVSVLLCEDRGDPRQLARLVRQEYRDCKDPVQKSKLVSFISNFTLSKQLQDSNNPDYRALPVAVSQQVCKQVYLNYKSFFSLLKKKTE